MSERDLQPDRSPLPLEVEQQIDRISDEFERAWKSGTPPRIEAYLDRVPAAGRLRLLEELLAVEFDLQQQAGDTLDVQLYRQRFPGSEAIIDAAMSLHARRKREEAEVPAEPAPADAAERDGQPDPQHIGRFEIRRRLGKGGFGVVYLAHDPGLDRLVALKVPRAELLATGQQRENLLHEARTAAKLKHPALVSVYEVQQQGDLIYIVQEYIDGQNLAQWMASRSRSWEHVVRWMIGIATAIGFAHRQGFVHRDLKPANILVDSQGHPHVADFGLALHESEQAAHAGEVSGTMAYMSPEQVRGNAHHLDGRTDIWSLGVILYELATGSKPFNGESSEKLRDEILTREPRPPRMICETIPGELEQIILRCLAKPVTSRYSNASALASDLQRVVEPARRWPWAVGMAAMLLIGCAIAWQSYLSSAPPSTPPSSASQPAQALKIESLEVQQFRGDPAKLLGTIGRVAHAAQVDDHVRVTARLSTPRYCYLLALNPDGTVDYCPKAQAGTPPSLTSEIVYPKDTDRYYGLTDGTGLQAFALVISRQPLPAFDSWPHRNLLSWHPPTKTAGVWRYDGHQYRCLASDIRGIERQVTSAPPASLTAVCDTLIGIPGVESVEAVAFPVENLDDEQSTLPEQ